MLMCISAGLNVSVSIAFETGALSWPRRAREPNPVYIYSTIYAHQNINKSPNGQRVEHILLEDGVLAAGRYTYIPFAPYVRLSRYNMIDIHWMFVCNLSSLYFKRRHDAKYQFALRLKRGEGIERRKKTRVAMISYGQSGEFIKIRQNENMVTGLRWGEMSYLEWDIRDSSVVFLFYVNR